MSKHCHKPLDNDFIIKDNQFGRVLRHASIYFINSVLTKALSFLFLPLITRMLLPEEYGLYQAYLSVASFLTIFASLYLDSAYARFFYDYNRSPEELAQLTSTLIWFLMGWGVLYFGLAIGMVYTISIYGFHSPWYPFAFLVPFSAIMKQFSALGGVYLRTYHETIKLGILNLVVIAVNYSVLLWLLLFMDVKAESFFISGGLSGMVGLTISLGIFYKRGLLKATWSSKMMREMLLFALAILPLSASSWIMDLSDKIIITMYDGFQSTGKYGLSYSIANLLQLGVASIFFVYGPMMMVILKSEHKEELKSRITSFLAIYLHALLGLATFLALFGPDVLEWMTPMAYHGDRSLIAIISFGFVFMGVRKLFANTLYYHKRTGLIVLTGFLPALLNLVLNLIFIPMFGRYAAAWTTLVCFLVYALVTWGFSQRLDPIKLPLSWIRKSLLLITLVVLTALVLRSHGWPPIQICVVETLFFVLSSWALGFVDLMRAENRQIKVV